MARLTLAAAAGIAAGFLSGDPVLGIQVFSGVHGVGPSHDPARLTLGVIPDATENARDDDTEHLDRD